MKINKDYKLIFLSTFGALFMTNIFLVFDTFKGDFLDSSKASEYGAFIGGYIGTILSFVSIVILYLTLKSQHESSVLDKFENKYFELIKLHRDNVIEISIKEQYGRKTFVSMFREFREVCNCFKNLIKQEGYILDDRDFYNIAYLIFFYGVGPNSSRVLRDSLSLYDHEMADKIVEYFEDGNLQIVIKKSRNFKYRPFGGHQSRLGHYYRHLYQSVVYVHRQNLSDDDKYEYIKILRAQLSTHEQALLFFNARSELGQKWDEDNLITKYRLIKNLPKNFINEEDELNVKAIYPDLIFEYEE